MADQDTCLQIGSAPAADHPRQRSWPPGDAGRPPAPPRQPRVEGRYEASHRDSGPLAPLSSAQTRSAATATNPEQSGALIALGGKLSAARQARGLSQEELADRLRLGTSQLVALENGDLDQLPETVFVIAQARRVAASLGVDPETELAALRRSDHRPVTSPITLELPSRDPLVSSARRPQPPAPRRSRPRPRSRARRLLPPAALALALAALVVGLSLRHRSSQGMPPAASLSLPGGSGPAGLRNRRDPGTAPDPSAADSLLLSSAPPSWIAVRDHDGRSLYEGTLAEQRRFPVGQGIEVYAGRPDLVMASLGAAAPRPLGSISQLEWRRFGPAETASTPAP